jgi:RNA polymerase sigma-70 factor (ECF subfamily)
VTILQTAAAEEVMRKSRYSAGSDLNLNQLFQQLYPRIYNYLRYRVNAVEDVEDLIGTIFEKAYAARNQYDPARGAFSTWLFRIAHNELVNHYRKRKQYSTWETGDEIPTDLTSSEPLPETQVIQRESLHQLLQGLEQLGERDQEVISLKFAGKLSNKEIGEIMDLKEKTVSVVLLRAIRRLRQLVEEEVSHE